MAVRGDQGRGSRQRALRIALTVLAVGLGTVAVWLIVTSDNAQRTKIGALAGFWALLIAAYPVLGIRHPQQAASGQELDVRAAGRLERTEDAAQRLEYERRLQLMVRHEIQQALGSELSSLRSEVAALRNEILEKVGGQIRLERIETTRMIGSDIEALQHEVRQLKVGGRGDDMTQVSRFAVEAGDLVQSMDDAVSRQLAAAEAEHAARLHNLAVQEIAVQEIAAQEFAAQEFAAQEPQRPQPVVHPEPVFAADHEPAPVPEQEPEPQPVPEHEQVPEHEPEHEPEPEPEQYHAVVEVHEPEPAPEFDDPFAAMPRLGPFADVEVEDEHADVGYAGRRRRAGEVPVLPGGRHAGGEADWATARPGGGRRHRDEDSSGSDILAEILRREGLRR